MSKKSVSIGEAAKFLGVSIDTVRRWDSQGTLHSFRPDGKNRYFSIEELEKIRYSKPLPIGEAAERLGISETTLRRLEEQGLISPERNGQGERLYTRECLKSFLDSDYYLRQKTVESKILDPENDETVEEKSQRMATQRKIINAQVEEHQQKINHLIIFRNIFYGTGLFLVTFLIFSVIIIAISFLLNPQGTAKWLGYRSSYAVGATKATEIQGDTIVLEQGKVLGATYNPNDKIASPSLWSKIFKPASLISLGIVKKVNAATYYQVVPWSIIDDVNDVLGINSNNEVTTRYTLTFPDTSYLHIPDQKLITNLNADYLRGKVPGDASGDLAVLNTQNFIDGLKIDQSNFTGQITESNKVAGSAAELSPIGGLMNNQGLSLITSCSANQVLQWNGSSWECATNTGTPPTYYSATNPLVYDPTTGNFSLNYDTIKWDMAFSHVSNMSNPHNVTADQVLPSQTGQNGKVLGTDGLSVSWFNSGALVETDPIFMVWDKSTGISITESQISDLQAYLTAETDPVAMGYLDQNVKTTSSPSFTGLSVGTLSGILKGTAGAVSAITDNSANWDTAFGSSHAAVTIGTGNGLSLSTQQLSLALSSAGTTGALSAGDWTTFSNKQGTLTFGDVTAGSTKVTIGGTGTGAVIGAGLTVDINEANITHNNLSGLTIGDPHTQYALLIGRSGGQGLSGGIDANDDLTLQGTTNATRTTSYVNLQPNGGNVGIGTTMPGSKLEVVDATPILKVKSNLAGGETTALIAGTVGSSFSFTNTGFFAIEGTAESAFGAGANYSQLTFGSTLNSLFGNSTYQTADIGSQLGVVPSTANKIGFIIKGASSQTANLMQWQNSSGTGLGAIDSSGNVGIGTTDPIVPLEILATTGRFFVGSTTRGNNASFELHALTSAGVAANVGLWAQPSGTTNYMGFSADASNYNMALWKGGGLAYGNTYYATNPGANNMIIEGNVGIGTSVPDFKLDVSGGLRIEGANALYFGGTGAGDTLGNLYHDGTDFVFSDTIKPTGYKSSDGTAGLGSAVTVKGSDGNDCVMTFKDGLMTSETCP